MDSARCVRRLPGALLLSLCGLLVVEAAVRLEHRRGGLLYSIGGDNEVTALCSVIEHGRLPEVALVGSSMMLQAVSPPQLSAALEERLGRPVSVGNFALPSTHAESYEFVLRRLVADARRRPRLIVVGTAMRDFRMGPPHLEITAPLWRVKDLHHAVRHYGWAALKQLPRCATNAARRHWRTLELRRGITARLNRHLGGAVFGTLPARGDPPSLHDPMYDDRDLVSVLPHYRTGDLQLGMIERYRAPTWPGQPRIAALGRMMALRQPRILILDLPTPKVLQDLVAALGSPMLGFDARYRQTLHEMAAASDAQFIESAELGLALEERDYRDAHHLHRRGATKFAQALAPMLAELLQSGKAAGAAAEEGEGSPGGTSGGARGEGRPAE